MLLVLLFEFVWVFDVDVEFVVEFVVGIVVEFVWVLGVDDGCLVFMLMCCWYCCSKANGFCYSE